MAKKIFLYRGKKLDELKNLTLNEFAELLPSRQRRCIKRGFSDQQKILLKNLKSKDEIETHCRDMIITPEMVGKKIKVHNGKQFNLVIVTDEMMGHYLGEFAPTRSKVSHSAPGIGATRSSSSLSVK